MPVYEIIKCPNCGTEIRRYKNPVPTVDIIIEVDTPDGRKGIVLIERKNIPHGWAIPGGFVDYGESCEQAAVREAKEETSLDVRLVRQLGAYSDPKRDPRQHTISIVFVARASGQPSAGDDAKNVGIFTRDNLPILLAFDHRRILNDYFESLNQP
ncbi:MAG: NUDIX hydrolase [Calditrichaeota bacterium]|nr:NUDIX hydrolase [Calditrichota bacterium]